MNETEETTVEPTPERDWKKVGLWVVVIAVLLLILWLAFAVRGANMRADARENEARRVGAVQSAIALSAAVEPLLDMRRRGETVDPALERVCRTMADSGRFELVAITDPRGVVIASTHMTLLDRPFPDVNIESASERRAEAGWQAVMPVQSGGVLFGGVVVQTK